MIAMILRLSVKSEASSAGPASTRVCELSDVASVVVVVGGAVVDVVGSPTWGTTVALGSWAHAQAGIAVLPTSAPKPSAAVNRRVRRRGGATRGRSYWSSARGPDARRAGVGGPTADRPAIERGAAPRAAAV